MLISNRFKGLLAALIPALVLSSTLIGAQTRKSRSDIPADLVLQDLHGQIEDMRQQQHNYRAEVEILEDKLRQQQQQAQTAIDALKSKIAALEARQGDERSDQRLATLEKKQQQIVADLRDMSKQTHEQSNLLQQSKSDLQDLDKRLESNVKNLKSAMQSVLELSQNGPTGSQPLAGSGSSSAYKVLPGDSLEKIAKKHHTNVDAIKKLNHLPSDKIVVGQSLQIP